MSNVSTNESIKNGRFVATRENNGVFLDGVRIFRHEDGIALTINGKLTSVNDKGKESVRGANNLYEKLDAILIELGL